MEDFIYTVGQQNFIDTVAAGGNIFLTGKAGTGKSVVVRKAIATLAELGRKVVAIAPTGIAANNIDGQTIHSMFNLTPFGILDFDKCQYMKGAKRDLLKAIAAIVIDEVSMLRPDVLDAIHWTLKKNGLKGLDERQLIFVGDMKQLPAPIDDNTRSVLLSTYDGETFDFAKIYKKLNVKTVELQEVLRQNNPEFITALNIVRYGGRSEFFRQFVSKEPLGVILAPHNATVKMYNEAGLKAQAGELFTFEAEIHGTAKPEDFNLEHVINVKNGCKIMYLVNSMSPDNPLRNGTLGTFVSHAGCHFFRFNDTDFALEPVIQTKKQYVYNKEADKLELKTIGKIVQFPFKLAYALSIHKSQGLTFDEATIDLSRPCFQKGQMYVALSRVRTPQGLRILVK